MPCAKSKEKNKNTHGDMANFCILWNTFHFIMLENPPASYVPGGPVVRLNLAYV